eukprot:TRINITY_DN17433_c0_g1_i1.p1 TRINITY_DN17433_c0_g1~~TRINITY_DN17433_c0_g1_i1.p1  ORF type:complete len:762 (-),score=82.13 TRINITY_DN17433_c0_g1_i1:83-2368(-)
MVQWASWGCCRSIRAAMAATPRGRNPPPLVPVLSQAYGSEAGGRQRRPLSAPRRCEVPSGPQAVWARFAAGSPGTAGSPAAANSRVSGEKARSPRGPVASSGCRGSRRGGSAVVSASAVKPAIAAGQEAGSTGGTCGTALIASTSAVSGGVSAGLSATAGAGASGSTARSRRSAALAGRSGDDSAGNGADAKVAACSSSALVGHGTSSVATASKRPVPALKGLVSKVAACSAAPSSAVVVAEGPLDGTSNSPPPEKEAPSRPAQEELVTEVEGTANGREGVASSKKRHASDSSLFGAQRVPTEEPSHASSQASPCVTPRDPLRPSSARGGLPGSPRVAFGRSLTERSSRKKDTMEDLSSRVQQLEGELERACEAVRTPRSSGAPRSSNMRSGSTSRSDGNLNSSRRASSCTVASSGAGFPKVVKLREENRAGQPAARAGASCASTTDGGALASTNEHQVLAFRVQELDNRCNQLDTLVDDLGRRLKDSETQRCHLQQALDNSNDTSSRLVLHSNASDSALGPSPLDSPRNAAADDRNEFDSPKACRFRLASRELRLLRRAAGGGPLAVLPAGLVELIDELQNAGLFPGSRSQKYGMSDSRISDVEEKSCSHCPAGTDRGGEAITNVGPGGHTPEASAVTTARTNIAVAASTRVLASARRVEGESPVSSCASFTSLPSLGRLQSLVDEKHREVQDLQACRDALEMASAAPEDRLAAATRLTAAQEELRLLCEYANVDPESSPPGGIGSTWRACTNSSVAGLS